MGLYLQHDSRSHVAIHSYGSFSGIIPGKRNRESLGFVNSAVIIRCSNIIMISSSVCYFLKLDL